MLNPILEKALGSVARWVLTLAIPFFVSNGIWTPEEATGYVAAGATALLALAWSLFEKYKSQLNLVTALTMPSGTTQAQVESRVKTGNTPPVTLDKNEVPRP